MADSAVEVLIDKSRIFDKNANRLKQIKIGLELISATKRFAKDDSRRSWWCVLSSFFLLIAALAGTVWNVNLLARSACSVLSGFLLMRAFVIYHDQQHCAILSKSELAERLMRIFGILALTP